MTVQTSKNPQVDIAEDNAFFPSEYSLSQYTSPVSDLDGVDYPKPYRGKHKILVIAADERYLPTDNGKLFSTGNHPIETVAAVVSSPCCRFRIRSGDHFRSDDQV
ncbi:chaperone protein [Escherichia coli]|nr:chaperone protein [Escherichia coli]